MAKSQAASTRKRGASRDLRSASPAIPAEPETKAKSPKKPRAKRAKKEKKEVEAVADSDVEDEDADELEEEIAAGLEEEAAIADALEAAEEAAEIDALMEAVAEAEEEDDEPLPKNTVRVKVHQDVADDGTTATTHTTVAVEIPADSPDLPLPTDTNGMVELAAQLVEDAKGLRNIDEGVVGVSAGSAVLKRKADVLEDDAEGPEEVIEELVEEAVPVANGVLERPAKRTRIMVPAEEYRRERVKRRAMIGLSSALAVGVLVPFISNLF